MLVTRLKRNARRRSLRTGHAGTRFQSSSCSALRYVKWNRGCSPIGTEWHACSRSVFGNFLRILMRSRMPSDLYCNWRSGRRVQSVRI